MNEKRMTASEARSMAQSVVNGKYNAELDKILSKIYQEAQKGGVKLSGLEIFSDYKENLFTDLRSLGYDVKVYHRGIGRSPFGEIIEISW